MRNRRNRTYGVSGGRRKQSGTPQVHGLGEHRLRARGLCVRGAILATYVQVDESPFPDGVDPGPVAVYCDVTTYGVSEGLHPTVLRRVPVFTDSGMHDGRVWKPRAATLDIVEKDLDVVLSQPFDLDGDHVLVEFLEDDLAQPFIRQRIPHPRLGLGNDGLPEAGHRMKLAVADGQPDLYKHRGSFSGFDDSGNFVLNTTRAHSGGFDGDGNEVPGDQAQNGNVFARIAHLARVLFEGLDPDQGNRNWSLEIDGAASTLKFSLDPNADGVAEVSIVADATTGAVSLTMDDGGDGNDEVTVSLDSPSSTVSVKTSVGGTPVTEAILDGTNKRATLRLGNGNDVEITSDVNGWVARLAGGANTLTLQDKDANALLTLGDGSVHVAIVEHLESLYNGLKSALESHTHPLADHKHSYIDPSGNPANTGTPSPSDSSATAQAFPTWDPAINSTKVSIPDG